MQIASVTPVLVDPGWAKHWLFVKVTADDGRVGWGEAYTQLDRDVVTARMVEELGRYLVGRSPFAVRPFTAMALDDFAVRRPSFEFYCALSGIEIALWDLAGQAAGQPVHNLLGGALRHRVRVYANGWYGGCRTPAEHAEAAVRTVAAGFDALKFDPFPGPFRSHIAPEAEERAVAIVAAVREAVGDGVDLLVEAHRRLAPHVARRVARRLEPLRPYWFEEPCPVDNVPGLAEVRAATTTPVVTGEALYGKAAFREVLEKRAADVLNPDVASVGGILELREIAAMAEPYQIAVSPHNFNSTTVALAATLHLAAAMPNFLIAEYFVRFREPGLELCPEGPVPENGWLRVPTGPGLGLAPDEAAMARRPYRQPPPRPLGGAGY